MTALSGRQDRAVVALLAEPTITAAAKRCGIGERTLRRWLADSTFRRAYRQAADRCLEDVLARLRTATGEALETLRHALAAKSEAVRVRAATALLDLAVKVQVDDLAERVTKLESLPSGGGA